MLLFVDGVAVDVDAVVDGDDDYDADDDDGGSMPVCHDDVTCW